MKIEAKVEVFVVLLAHRPESGTDPIKYEYIGVRTDLVAAHGAAIDYVGKQMHFTWQSARKSIAVVPDTDHRLAVHVLRETL